MDGVCQYVQNKSSDVIDCPSEIYNDFVREVDATAFDTIMRLYEVDNFIFIRQILLHSWQSVWKTAGIYSRWRDSISICFLPTTSPQPQIAFQN